MAINGWREPAIQFAPCPQLDVGGEVTAGEPQQGRERHQIIAETGHRHEIRDQIKGQQQIGERGQHGEPHLGWGFPIQQQFQAFQRWQGDRPAGPAQQALQHPLIHHAAFEHLGLDGALSIAGAIGVEAGGIKTGGAWGGLS